MDKRKLEEGLHRAVAHMEFVCRLYRMQLAVRGCILHEHPAGATSWKLPCAIDIMSRDGVSALTGNLCCFGMPAKDDDGVVRPVAKLNRFMSNLPRPSDLYCERC